MEITDVPEVMQKSSERMKINKRRRKKAGEDDRVFGSRKSARSEQVDSSIDKFYNVLQSATMQCNRIQYKAIKCSVGVSTAILWDNIE
jgi:hypothetical protein